MHEHEKKIFYLFIVLRNALFGELNPLKKIGLSRRDTDPNLVSNGILDPAGFTEKL
jgi:hypothetical protein